MDVKEAHRMVDNKRIGSFSEEMMARGFLEFRDQLKATGVIETAKDVEDFLQSDDMGRQWRDEVLVKLREALSKLSALMGEKP